MQAWRGALMGDLGVQLGGAPVEVVSTAAIGRHVLVFSAWALAAYALGYAVFVVSKRRFADEV